MYYKLHIILFSAFTALLLFSCTSCREKPIEAGSFELAFIPKVNGERIEKGVPVVNIQNRKYRIDFFLMYIADITLVKENGEEILLSEINLYDFLSGGEARHTSEENAAFKKFDLVDVGNYKGVKFGIGVPDRLNTGPASYPVNHPLSVGSSMYWSWRTGYKFLSMEGFIDQSPDNNGTALDLPIAYHTGKDSINSPNVIYREVSFLDNENAFTIQSGQTVHFNIELDINRMFYNETDTLDMVRFNISHSVPGEQFDISRTITDNLVNGALHKEP
ncbi:MAG: MbnP family protein [Bacteroidia bacterium]|nr:MbnP family protein [Bacteroidia bacterium]